MRGLGAVKGDEEAAEGGIAVLLPPSRVVNVGAQGGGQRRRVWTQSSQIVDVLVPSSLLQTSSSNNLQSFDQYALACAEPSLVSERISYLPTASTNPDPALLNADSNLTSAVTQYRSPGTLSAKSSATQPSSLSRSVLCGCLKRLLRGYE